MINTAWNSVSSCTIANSFRKAGFPTLLNDNESLVDE